MEERLAGARAGGEIVGNAGFVVGPLASIAYARLGPRLNEERGMLRKYDMLVENKL